MEATNGKIATTIPTFEKIEIETDMKEAIETEIHMNEEAEAEAEETNQT